MNRTSCLIQAPKDRFIMATEKQCEFCNGNGAAALVLAYFAFRHNGKLLIDAKNKRMNDIAEAHGDNRFLPEDTLINFTIAELMKAILYLAGRNAIIKALNLLQELGVISIHKNPNPKHIYDKSRYVRFYPEVYNNWLLKLLKEEGNQNSNVTTEEKTLNDDLENYTQAVDSSDGLNLKDRDADLQSPSSEFKRSTLQNESGAFNFKPYIRNINNNINNNQSINARTRELFDEKNKTSNDLNSPDVKPIIDALTAKGFAHKHFQFADTAESIRSLLRLGANVGDFERAYDRACSVKGSHDGFGLRYLAKIIEGMLSKSKNTNTTSTLHNPASKTESSSKPVYENDYSNGLDWMGDLLTEQERNQHAGKH